MIVRVILVIQRLCRFQEFLDSYLQFFLQFLAFGLADAGFLNEGGIEVSEVARERLDQGNQTLRLG